ncbi:MAG: VOC family protein [Eubacteriales bacterium]|nr:VOC family protein [Eubacteriales bacterium]
MAHITPCLWFADNNTEEAVNYYLTVFPNSRIISRDLFPEVGVDGEVADMTGKMVNMVFELNGLRMMAFDGGPYFRLSEAFSLTVECKDQAEIDYYWEKLSHVPESEQCGWCKDRFGVSWQIVPRDAEALLMKNEATIRAFMQMKKLDIARLKEAAGGTPA